MTDDVNDFLFGGGMSAKFDTIGTEHKGRILSMKMGQEKDFATKKPKFWEDGSPVMQAVVTLQTDRRDDDDDDGQRKVYISSPRMRQAVRDAVRKSGARKMVAGGQLAVKYVGTDPESKNPANPAKLYAAAYKAPEPGEEIDPQVEDVDDLDGYSEEPF